VGHAESFDAAKVEGKIADGGATVRFERGGLLLAAATLGQDLESLRIEVGLEG
jgi:hypothetical protein